LGEGTRGAATGHGGSSNSETIEQVGCWMGDSPDLGMEVSSSISDLGDKLLPARAIEVELVGLLDELVELIKGGVAPGGSHVNAVGERLGEGPFSARGATAGRAIRATVGAMF
jgi:hypothetical protein